MPRYWRQILVAAADVRRIRTAAGLTQAELAAELGYRNVRTIERMEHVGAVLAHQSSLTLRYNESRIGKLELIARRGGLALELVDVDTSYGFVAKVKKPKTRHFPSTSKKRARKTRQATRSRRPPGRGIGEKR